jgi:hypothetical protein
MLEAGWAAAEWAFGLACAARQRRHVVARRGRSKRGWQHGRLNGQGARMPWWTGRALVVVGARLRRGHDAWAVARVGRRRACPSRATGRRITGPMVPLVFGANSVHQPRTTSTQGLELVVVQGCETEPTECPGCLVNLVSALSHCGNRSSGPRVRLEGLSFLFGSVDGRGRGAGSLRELAPSNLRGCTRRRASGTMAASRGPSGPLRGSPLPRGDNQRTSTSSMRKAGLRHKCIVMAQSATCALVRRLSWRTHN